MLETVDMHKVATVRKIGVIEGLEEGIYRLEVRLAILDILGNELSVALLEVLLDVGIDSELGVDICEEGIELELEFLDAIEVDWKTVVHNAYGVLDEVLSYVVVKIAPLWRDGARFGSWKQAPR